MAIDHSRYILKVAPFTLASIMLDAIMNEHFQPLMSQTKHSKLRESPLAGPLTSLSEINRFVRFMYVCYLVRKPPSGSMVNW